MDKPKIISFPRSRDRDAWLSVAENGRIPFEIRRVFYLSGFEKDSIRGEHAHKSSRQLLVALSGTIEVSLEDISGRLFEFILDQEHKALYIPPLYWGKMIFEKGSIALALASDNFSEDDYIRDYEEFKSMDP